MSATSKKLELDSTLQTALLCQKCAKIQIFADIERYLFVALLLFSVSFIKFHLTY